MVSTCAAAADARTTVPGSAGARCRAAWEPRGTIITSPRAVSRPASRWKTMLPARPTAGLSYSPAHSPTSPLVPEGALTGTGAGGLGVQAAATVAAAAMAIQRIGLIGTPPVEVRLLIP